VTMTSLPAGLPIRTTRVNPRTAAARDPPTRGEPARGRGVGPAIAEQEHSSPATGGRAGWAGGHGRHDPSLRRGWGPGGCGREGRRRAACALGGDSVVGSKPQRQAVADRPTGCDRGRPCARALTRPPREVRSAHLRRGRSLWPRGRFGVVDRKGGGRGSLVVGPLSPMSPPPAGDLPRAAAAGGVARVGVAHSRSMRTRPHALREVGRGEGPRRGAAGVEELDLTATGVLGDAPTTSWLRRGRDGHGPADVSPIISGPSIPRGGGGGCSRSCLRDRASSTGTLKRSWIRRPSGPHRSPRAGVLDPRHGEPVAHMALGGRASWRPSAAATGGWRGSRPGRAGTRPGRPGEGQGSSCRTGRYEHPGVRHACQPLPTGSCAVGPGYRTMRGPPCGRARAEPPAVPAPAKADHRAPAQRNPCRDPPLALRYTPGVRLNSHRYRTTYGGSPSPAPRGTRNPCAWTCRTVAGEDLTSATGGLRTLTAWRSDGTLSRNPRSTSTSSPPLPGPARAAQRFFARLHRALDRAPSCPTSALAGPKEDRYRLLRAGLNLAVVVSTRTSRDARTW
jgi:hypothetical protein